MGLGAGSDGLVKPVVKIELPDVASDGTLSELDALQGQRSQASASPLHGNSSVGESGDEQSSSPAKAQTAQTAQNPVDGVPGAVILYCVLCMKRTRADKSKHCKVCKSDIQAARREAEARGEGKWLAELLKKGGEELVDFMRTFVSNSGERRKYSNRARFDFISYREARRVQTAFRLGFKARVAKQCTAGILSSKFICG